MNKIAIVKSGKSVFFTDQDVSMVEQKKLISFVMAQLGRSRSKKKLEALKKNVVKARAQRWK